MQKQNSDIHFEAPPAESKRDPTSRQVDGGASQSLCIDGCSKGPWGRLDEHTQTIRCIICGRTLASESNPEVTGV